MPARLTASIETGSLGFLGPLRAQSAPGLGEPLSVPEALVPLESPWCSGDRWDLPGSVVHPLAARQ